MLKSNIKKKTCYGGCRNRRKINIIQTRKKEVTLFQEKNQKRDIKSLSSYSTVQTKQLLYK